MTEPNPVAVSRARSLRRTQTKQESLLWGKLRDRRLTGYKFVRQAPIGPYFADFLCKEAKLLVELDGSQHGESNHDVRRDGFLVDRGYRVLRFWNEEVMRQMDDVCETIFAAIEGRLEAYDRYKLPSSASARHLLPGGEKENAGADR